MENDRSFPFRVLRFRGGLHSMRDLPSKIFLARESVRMGNYDVVHAADWPFFIPLALSRKRTHGRLLMTVHGTEINEMQAPLKRLAIRTARVFGPRWKWPPTADSRVTFLVRTFPSHRTGPGYSAWRFGFLVWLIKQPGRDPRCARPRAGQNRHGHRRAAHPPQGASPDTCRTVRLCRNDCENVSRWLVIGPDGEADYVVELHRLIEESDATFVCSARCRMSRSGTFMARAISFV